MTAWHIITCEYPPQVGGVGDYTRLLAEELRKVESNVQVWAPPFDGVVQPGVHRVLTLDLRYLRTIDPVIDAFGEPRTLLVQWVPHGYGKRGINLGFCRWIASRVRRGDTLYVMVHEPCLEPGQRLWKHRFISLMQRRMVRILLRSATRVFISIPGWESRLQDLAPPMLRFEWLPIPATIDASPDSKAVALIRSQVAPHGSILGHLGTYSSEMRRILAPSLVDVLDRSPNAHVFLLGSNSHHFADLLKTRTPAHAARIHGTGLLSDTELANHIAACDLMLQPYPDGLSSRRTSLMNALAQGTPVVSNLGHLSESLWEESQAVALAATGEPTQLASLCLRLLADEPSRRKLGAAGRELYQSRFDWQKIVATLRSSAQSQAAAAGEGNQQSLGKAPLQ